MKKCTMAEVDELIEKFIQIYENLQFKIHAFKLNDNLLFTSGTSAQSESREAQRLLTFV